MSGREEPSQVQQGEASAATAATAVRTPDFFIVGHQKCGTTALYMMLSQHPQIFMSDVKEPWFFARELRLPSDKPSTRGRPNTLEEYLELFADAPADQLAGEASPQGVRSRLAAQEIAELRPDAKIVVLLREPAAFLRSLHLQFISTHIEDEPDLGRAMELEERRRQGKDVPSRSLSPQSLLYTDHVHYAEQLRRLHDAFPREQVLVLIYEEFRRDNMAILRQVLEFLSVDPDVPIEPVETKKLEDVRSMRLHQLRRAIRKAGLNPAKRGRVVKTLDALPPRSLTGDSISAAFRRVAYRPQRSADDELMLQLRRRFKPQVEEAGEYLGRDLVTLWGYDRIS
ncbi:MAG: sulfotransferase family protein [Solirubrobacteraceae bacterium]